MNEDKPFMLDPKLIQSTIAEICDEEADRKYVRKYAEYVFVRRTLLGVAFVASVGVSWVMASLMHAGFLALVFTWMFWIALIAFVCLYMPPVWWHAHQRGAFDE